MTYTSFSRGRYDSQGENSVRRIVPVLLIVLALFASACEEGDVNTYVFAKTPFNEHTGADADWAFMNENYDRMLVWEPYWDSRLDDYGRAIVYENAYAIKVNTDKDPRSVDHPDWLLREADGTPVYIPFGCANGCPQFAADLGNQEFVDAWIADAQEVVAKGYMGLYIDDVNLNWRFGDVNGDEVAPINPRTGEPLQQSEWRRYTVEFLERVRAEFPDIEIWHNVIWYADTPDFTNGMVRRQIQSADVIHLERGMNDPGLVGGSGRFGMETFMRYIDRVHDLERSVALLDTHATTIDEQVFNIAGYLLVNNGTDYVSTEDWDLLAPGAALPEFTIDIGSALGDRVVGPDGVISREFTEGLVLMNQPRRDPATVDLGGEWLTQDGHLVTEVALGTRDAVVLLRP